MLKIPFCSMSRLNLFTQTFNPFLEYTPRSAF
ncbi:Uncharacterised protein [Klebsiella pneumoniae]|nr:Uncharacterised protein [Klebsiella pneumoniae]